MWLKQSTLDFAPVKVIQFTFTDARFSRPTKVEMGIQNLALVWLTMFDLGHLGHPRSTVH